MKTTLRFFTVAAMAAAVALQGWGSPQQHSLSTRYLGVDMNEQGYIVGLRNLTRTPQPNFSPIDQPSPLLALYDEETSRYFYPTGAVYGDQTISLAYANGSVATIRCEQKDKYLKFTLLGLAPRNGIDDVQWGRYYTSIDNLMGEVIGVARDTSQAVNYAIGVLALDDNTIGGESRYTADFQMEGYMVHTPDRRRFPLPVEVHEGQKFALGGNGILDWDFYERKEPYFRDMCGTSAGCDESGRIYLCYHSRDRRTGKVIYVPEGWPPLQNWDPIHLKRQDVPDVDFIGSSIALWGSPDSTALMDVVQDIVLGEGLPHPMYRGKWIKDPTAYEPDLWVCENQYDSIASYAKAMGLHGIHAYDHPGPFIKPNRTDGGYIDGRKHPAKPYHFATGNLSHDEYARLLAKDGIVLGRTCITTSLAPGTKDASPVPSDSVCVLHRHFLARDVSPADTMIYIDNPLYMDEVASWEAHDPQLNIVKIGKELIHYLGVSGEAPHRLLNVTRGYWGTKAVAHTAGDAIDKLQTTTWGDYSGLVPNLDLQDKIARYYADVCKNSGIRMIDFDGQEFLFFSGFGTYSAKRFFRNLFDQLREYRLPDLRITGATLSEGSWHYQSMWNIGHLKDMYDTETREWGSSHSEGKDLRDCAFSNFFPATMGVNFPINAKSTVEEYEHVEATSVGYGSTYFLRISQKDVESCPCKYQIFRVIRTWEAARRADAFPESIKRLLRDPKLDWRLEEGKASNTWTLYRLEDGQVRDAYPLCGKQG